MSGVTSAVRRMVQAMPKAELHLHLDGCLRPQTALDLAAQFEVDAPTTWDGMFDALVAAAHPGSQAELLRSFELPLQLMQHRDALTRITTDLVEDKAADNVKYMELKWAPAVHREAGLTLDDVIETVATAASAAAARLNVVVRLTVVAMRSADPALNLAVARAAVRHADVGVTGFDLAGFEAADPDPTVHAAAFDIAREGGLGLTVHTGELVDGGELVWRALELRPDRIAHGANAAADPALVSELRTRRVTLDLCPTSNVQAGTVRTFANHPLVWLLRQGVPVTINTDDTTISDITLSEELLTCIDLLGLTLPELWRCNLHALEVAFVDEPTRASLLTEFERWALRIPELRADGR
jgi:adenosine deaminase